MVEIRVGLYDKIVIKTVNTRKDENLIIFTRISI